MGSVCKSIYTIRDAPIFSLDGYKVLGKVHSVYDGDSVKIIFPFHGIMYKWNCRLSGIDTPELRTKCDDEKKMAYHVRDVLREKILDKVVSVECGKFDKYGRLLATLTCNDDSNCCINTWLVENKYAVAYEGGKRVDWSALLAEKK